MGGGCGASSPRQLILELSAYERYQENIVQLLNRNNKQTVGMVNKQKTNSWGGEQTVGLEQPPGTAKTLFDECVDQIWILECTSDDHHT